MKSVRIPFLVLLGICLVPAMATAKTAKSKTEPSGSALRLAGVFAQGAGPGPGIGLTADYDIPVWRKAGPGHVSVAPAGWLTFASANNRTDLVASALGAGRYTLDAHPKLRPWVRLGVGAYWIDHNAGVDSQAGAVTGPGNGNGNGNGKGKNNDPGTGTSSGALGSSTLAPGVLVGLGLDVHLRNPKHMISVSVDAHRTTDDFETVLVGFGWRF